MPFLPTTIDQPNILSSSISDFCGFSGQNQPQLAQQEQLQLQHQQQLPLPPPPSPPPSLPPPPQPLNVPLSLRFNNSPQQRKLHQQGSQRPETTNSVHPLRNTPSPARSRKKKSNMKRQVMQVTADNLCNDVWAWRKYGQKPIKGSPYPRNYYRCSSSKGCAARKQVERSNTDPNMFVVSYSGDHTHPRPTHRNSLAGSTRNKFPTIQKPDIKETEEPSGEKAPCSSPLSATSLSPTTPLSVSMEHELAANENIGTDAGNMDGADLLEGHGMESDGDGEGDGDGDGDGDGYSYDDEDDEDILIPNMMLNEDIIKGLQELGTFGDGAFGFGSTNSGGLGRSPDFGDNFSSWAVGSSAAVAGARGGD
ncbi:hypothetical protein JCGZ_26041 [Jatropha curcas]|uniref:WRKY transcription factor 48 n=2 Tax=Jatropha curcas TaxID=180498 RepID=S5CH65_JATCU|nr:WRKY transcription factor 48 [Jatropha curcas]KDP22210.1 hypothetical protein JCGZ_26041 [Jatropha curcas]